LRALFLPPMAWSPYRRTFVLGEGPNPLEVYDVLQERGIESEILDPHAWPINPFSGKNTLLDSLDVSRAVRVLTKRRHVDIVVSVAEGGAVPLVLARAALAFRPPVVLWDIGLTEAWKLRQRVLDIAVPRVDGIMVLSSNQTQYIERRWPTRSSPRVIFHHVDVEFFAPQTESASEYILSVGDDIGRDFGTLLAAVQTIVHPIKIKTRRPISFDPNLHRHVDVIGARISYLELRRLYAHASFVVVPLVETLNASGVSTVLEAGAMGKALIVSNTEAMRNYFVPNETCLAVPPGDVTALREAIDRLSRDIGLRQTLGRNARNFVSSRFANRPFAERLATALQAYA